MQATSDNLIHFLGKQYKGSPNEQLGIFKSIINLGLGLSKTKIILGGGEGVDNHIACFTDIPLSFCDEHTEKYGKFGIGFKKSSIKKCGGSPARYFINYLSMETQDKSLIDNRGSIYDNLCVHFEFVKKLKEALNNDHKFALYDQNKKEIFSCTALKDWVDQQLTVLSFEKETGDLGPVLDETNGIDQFYKEREWRLVPLIGNLNSGSVIYDESKKSYYYKFKRKDINMVVTPNDEIRTEVVRFLLGLEKEADDRLKEFAKNPLPIITYNDLHKW